MTTSKVNQTERRYKWQRQQRRTAAKAEKKVSKNLRSSDFRIIIAEPLARYPGAFFMIEQTLKSSGVDSAIGIASISIVSLIIYGIQPLCKPIMFLLLNKKIRQGQPKLTREQREQFKKISEGQSVKWG